MDENIKRVDNRLNDYIKDSNENNIHDIRTAVRRLDASYRSLPKSMQRKNKISKYMRTSKLLFKINSQVRDYDIICEKLQKYSSEPIYTRVSKSWGIEPFLTTDHGVSIAFYYKDPDGNTIELFVDNFGNWDRFREHMQSSPDFNRTVASMTIGTFVDAEKLVAAGMSFAELHRRVYAGEFPASRPMNLHDLI